MPIANILSEIDAEISVLLKVKQLLSGIDSAIATRRRGRPVGSGVVKKQVAAPPLSAITPPLRKMSEAGRARIAAAMKARWKKVRQAAKKATAKKAASKKSPAKKASPAPTNASA